MLSKESVDMLGLLFQAVELLGMFGGGAIILIKMGRMMGTFETIGNTQAREISELKEDIKSVNNVITQVAVQKAEIASLDQRVGLLMTWYDELRHGHGYVKGT